MTEAHQMYDDLLEALSPILPRTFYQDVRRALPKRFPYSVYYRVHADRVEVVAVFACTGQRSIGVVGE